MNREEVWKWVRLGIMHAAFSQYLLGNDQINGAGGRAVYFFRKEILQFPRGPLAAEIQKFLREQFGSEELKTALRLLWPGILAIRLLDLSYGKS